VFSLLEVNLMNRDQLEEKEIVVHVAKGEKVHVRVAEQDPKDLAAEIVVQVSKKRKPAVTPVLGVIVK
jgi:hypothetical protein